MSDFDHLKRVVEDNFVLLSIETRELRGLVSQQGQRFTETLDTITTAMKRLESDLGQGNRRIEDLLQQRADRLDTAVEAIRGLGDSSVDLRKEIAELRERVQKLEDKAS